MNRASSQHLLSRRTAAILFCIASLVCISCAAERSSGGDRGPTAPAPYSAEAIRAQHPVGTELVFEFEQNGTAAVIQTMAFVEADGDGAVVETSVTTPQGRPVGGPARSSATWIEMRDHAAFPLSATERTEATCDVPAGRFDCWLYTVRGEDRGVPTVTRYYFAKSRPGPPVLVDARRGSEVAMRMALRAVHGSASTSR